jgi:hypothetical protein
MLRTSLKVVRSVFLVLVGTSGLVIDLYTLLEENAKVVYKLGTRTANEKKG